VICERKKKDKAESVRGDFDVHFYLSLFIRIVLSITSKESSRAERSTENNPDYARPISNHSLGVFSPCTIERMTGSALEKSENSTCGMSSLLQYVARSLSPSDFSFTNSTSACFAADMSGITRTSIQGTEKLMGAAPETPSPKKKSNGGVARFLYGRIAWDLSCPNPLRRYRIQNWRAEWGKSGPYLEG